MITRHIGYSLAAMATVLIPSSVMAAESKAMAQPKHQHCMSGGSASMTAGNTNTNHEEAASPPTSAHSTKMPAAKRSMQKMSGCGGSQKAEPMAAMKTPSPHKKHADPSTAKPKAKPATDTPMPKHDHM